MSAGMKEQPAESEGGHDRFVDYYAHRSLTPAVQANFESIQRTVIRYRARRGLPVESLDVADIGCNVGVQCILWARQGHRVHGIDIDEAFIRIARERSTAAGLDVDYHAASAAALPWPTASMDICLLPELLEHVAEWRACLDECLRILRPGGSIFISTTSRLCPRQQEFDLPLYSWYPAALKRWCVKRATSSHPQWVNYAAWPAVNWFSWYQLRDDLERRGFDCADRFAIADRASMSRGAALLARLAVANPVLRFLGHVMTPYTMLIATRRG